MTDKKLKPCPFCGGEAKVRNFISGRDVHCKNCYASVKILDSNEEAIKAWNTRTNTIPVDNSENYKVVQG